MKHCTLGTIRNLLAVTVFTVLAMQVTTYAGSITLNNIRTGSGELAVQVIDSGGNIRVTLSSASSDFVTMRAFYAHLTDESLLPGLLVSGKDVSASTVSTVGNDVISVGDSSNGISVGPDSSGPFDIGIEFTTPEISLDSFEIVEFELSHETEELSVEDVAGQDIGIVFEYVDENGNESSGITEFFVTLSSEIVQSDDSLTLLSIDDSKEEILNVVNPEPTTVVLLGIGLAGMAGVSFRRMRKNGTTKKA